MKSPTLPFAEPLQMTGRSLLFLLRMLAGVRGSPEQLRMVSFNVGGECYAVDITVVQEINRMLQITRVPQSPPDVEGVINLRGRIIPIIDLRKRFGSADKELDQDNRIIVVEVQQRILGFIVDGVHEVLRISSSIVEAAPSMTTSIDSDYIEGVGKLEDRLLILLDLKRLFNLEQIDQVISQTESGAEA